MQLVELDAASVGLRNGVDDTHFGAQSGHFRRDSELRDEGEDEHEVDEKVDGSEGLGGAGCQLAVGDRSDHEYDTTDEAHGMEYAERAVDDISGEFARGKDAGSEDSWGDDEGEENQAAEPDDESEEHEEAEGEGHVGIIAEGGSAAQLLSGSAK